MLEQTTKAMTGGRRVKRQNQSAADDKLVPFFFILKLNMETSKPYFLVKNKDLKSFLYYYSNTRDLLI